MYFNQVKRFSLWCRAGAAIVLSTSGVAAQAHVSILSGPHFESSYSEFKLVIPHGCKGVNIAGEEHSFDTDRIEVMIDKGYGLTGLRPINSEYGKAVITETDTHMILTWAKSDAAYASDSHAYNVLFRAKTAATPFTMLYFPSTQFCTTDTGEQIKAEWVGMGTHEHDSAMTTDMAVKPAPKTYLYPKRLPGWNLYATDQHVHDLTVFNDAQIVWTQDKTKAWSANAEVMKMIVEDENVSVLEEIHPGFEIWVKY